MFNVQLVLSPLTNRGAEDFSAWVRARTLAQLRERLSLYREFGAKSDDKREIIDAALESLREGDAEAEAIKTTEGLTQLVWLMLRDRYPITVEQVGALIAFSDRKAIRNEVGRLIEGRPSTPSPAAETPPPAPPATAPRKEQTPTEKRNAIFNRMCWQWDKTPQELVNMRIEAAAELYCQVAQTSEVDHMRLKKYLIEFAEANGGLKAEVHREVVETLDTDRDPMIQVAVAVADADADAKDN